MGWSKLPSSFKVELSKDYLTTISYIGMEVHRRLVLKTPVRTGRAQSNWWPSVNQGTSEISNEVSPSVSFSAALTKFSPSKLEDFPTLYITNNLDYIAGLNAGNSIQAPANFVQATVQEVLGVF
jgi:hypothetical protein